MPSPHIPEKNEGNALPSPCSHGPQFPSPPSSPTPNYVLTLVAVTDGAEVHIVLVVGEEEKAEPGVEGVDGHNEEDAHDVALLIGATVAAQMHVDLGEGHQSVKTYCYPPASLPATCPRLPVPREKGGS